MGAQNQIKSLDKIKSTN